MLHMMVESKAYIRYFHRDLKPDNLCYENGKIKSIDMDDAKVVKGDGFLSYFAGIGITLNYIGNSLALIYKLCKFNK